MNLSGPQLPSDHPLRRLPTPAKRLLTRSYWVAYDTIDFLAEVVGKLPSHLLRLFLYRHLFRVQIGAHSSVHRGCRIYHPSGVRIGLRTIVNRDVLLDGRSGLHVGDNVSISEGTAVFTLEHDPDSPTFKNRGASVHIGNRAFVGARAIVLPGATIGEGAVVAAGAVVTGDVEPFSIVGGVPARCVGQRRRDLDYSLIYRKFLG